MCSCTSGATWSALVVRCPLTQNITGRARSMTSGDSSGSLKSVQEPNRVLAWLEAESPCNAGACLDSVARVGSLHAPKDVCQDSCRSVRLPEAVPAAAAAAGAQWGHTCKEE
jgi:hypothetical protein